MVDTEIIDFMDLLDYTFDSRFINTWKSKYGSRLLKCFQLKLFEYFSNRKILRLQTLTNYLNKKCKYKVDVIEEFYNDIEISLYRPFVV